MQIQSVEFQAWAICLDLDELFIHEQSLPKERRELVNLISLQIPTHYQPVKDVMQRTCLYAMDLDKSIDVIQAQKEITTLIQLQLVDSTIVGDCQYIKQKNQY